MGENINLYSTGVSRDPYLCVVITSSFTYARPLYMSVLYAKRAITHKCVWEWPRGHVQVVYAGVGGGHLGKPHRQNITSNLTKVTDDWTSSTGVWIYWMYLNVYNKQDLLELCIFTLSYGNISMTLLTRHFESYQPPIRPVSCHIAPTLVKTAPASGHWAVTYPGHTGLPNKQHSYSFRGISNRSLNTRP